jgi:hypothetical protein
MRNSVASYLLKASLYLLLQVFVFLKLNLFNTAFCYVYVAFIIALPLSMPRITQLFVAFGIGLIVDIFYNTLGINAAASLIIMYLRPYIFRIVPQPTSSPDVETQELSLQNFSFGWILQYYLIMIFLHHLLLVFIEAAGFTRFGYHMMIVFYSTLFTLVVSIIIQLTLYSKGRR